MSAERSRSKVDLHAEVIRLCGLSALLAPGLIRRALLDVGAEVGAASPLDYSRALPALEARMRTYLPADDVTDRLAQIRRLLGVGADEESEKGRR